MKIKRSERNGQAQCKGCKDNGKWNVQWCTFLYEIEGKEGLYCISCMREIDITDRLMKGECINPNQ